MSSISISNRELQELVKCKVSITELTEKALQYEHWSSDVDFNTVGTLEIYLSTSWAKEVDNLYETTGAMLNSLQKKHPDLNNCDIPNLVANSPSKNHAKGARLQNIKNELEDQMELLEDFVDDLTALKNQSSFIKKRQPLDTEILGERTRKLTFERPKFHNRQKVSFCRIYDHSGKVIGDKNMFALTGNACCGIPIDDICVSEKYCKHQQLRGRNGVPELDIFANNDSNLTIDQNNNSCVLAVAIYSGDENNNSHVVHQPIEDGFDNNAAKRALFVRKDLCGEKCGINNAESGIDNAEFGINNAELEINNAELSLDMDDIRFNNDIPHGLDESERQCHSCGISPRKKNPKTVEKVTDIWVLDIYCDDTRKLHHSQMKKKRKRVIRRRYSYECQSKPDLVIKTMDKMQNNYDIKKDPVNSLRVDKLARKERKEVSAASEKIGQHNDDDGSDGCDGSFSSDEKMENLVENEGFYEGEKGRYMRPFHTNEEYYNTNNEFNDMFVIACEEDASVSNKVVPDNNEILFGNLFPDEEVYNGRDTIAPCSHFSKYWMSDVQYSIEVEKMYVRVQKWFDNIDANIEENEELFDQRSYEYSVLEKLEKAPIMSFQQLCAGVKLDKVCILFITCLNLVNSKNIQLEKLNAEPRMMDVAVFKLLKMERHYQQLNEGLVPIISSFR